MVPVIAVTTFQVLAMDEVANLLDTANEDSSKLVSLVEMVLNILENNNLAYRARLPPKVVGVHPQNRGG